MVYHQCPNKQVIQTRLLSFLGMNPGGGSSVILMSSCSGALNLVCKLGWYSKKATCWEKCAGSNPNQSSWNQFFNTMPAINHPLSWSFLLSSHPVKQHIQETHVFWTPYYIYIYITLLCLTFDDEYRYTHIYLDRAIHFATCFQTSCDMNPSIDQPVGKRHLQPQAFGIPW